MSAARTIELNDGSTAELHREVLPSGDAGVYKTLEIMERLVMRDAKSAVVKAIVKAHKGRTQKETAQNLFRYMIKSHKYVADPKDREHFTAPVYILSQTTPFAYKDCDDLAGAMAALLSAAGITNAFKIISWRKTEPEGQFTHVYNEALLDGSWTPIDLVMRDNGFGNEKKPVLRAERWIVGSGKGEALSDDALQYPDINWQAIGKDILSRCLPEPIGKGEDVGEVLKQHVTSICVESVKQQLIYHKPKLILAAGVAGIFFATTGAVATLIVQRLRMNRMALGKASKASAKSSKRSSQ